MSGLARSLDYYSSTKAAFGVFENGDPDTPINMLHRTRIYPEPWTIGYTCITTFSTLFTPAIYIPPATCTRNCRCDREPWPGPLPPNAQACIPASISAP
jgi:hypothetical protein